MSDTLLELNVAWAKRYQDDITTLRAEVERLTWRVNNWRGCFEQQNERARKAEAERDAAIARAEKLEHIIRRYCDRTGMANAPAEIQQTIDDVFARASLTQGE